MKGNTVESIIVNRLGQKLGVTEALLAEAQVYNEILIKQNEELRKQNEELQKEIEELKAKEGVEESGGSEDEVEGE